MSTVLRARSPQVGSGNRTPPSQPHQASVRGLTEISDILAMACHRYREFSMCGRFTLSTPAARLIELFQVTAFPRMEPRHNICPTQMVISIRLAEAEREAVMMRWGLVPSWANDVSMGNRMINARSETAAEKPSFRSAYRKRRCLIPVDGFYEWEKLEGRRKQPWRIHLAENVPFAFAGLWESWRPKQTAQSDAPSGHGVVESCTILTTAANADLSPIHDRMPVIVEPRDYATWLDTSTSPDILTELMQPSPAGTLERVRVPSPG